MPDSLHSFFSPQEIKTLHAARREIEIRDASVAYCVYENPFARSGGIFAVAENYGRELLSRGRDAVFLSPFHSRLKSQPAETEVAEVGNCRVPFGGEMIPLRLFEHLCKGVRWILFRADGYFEASGGVGGTDPYIHEDGDRLLIDSLFASAAIPRVLSALGMKENVIVHVQDWELASAALSVKQAILDGMLKSAAVVLTSHNPYDCGLPLAALRLITPRKHRGDEPIENPDHAPAPSFRRPRRRPRLSRALLTRSSIAPPRAVEPTCPMRLTKAMPTMKNTAFAIHIVIAGFAMRRSASTSPPMRPVQYMLKIILDASTTIPTPPRGKRNASGGPTNVKTMHAKAIASFLWISTL